MQNAMPGPSKYVNVLCLWCNLYILFSAFFRVAAAAAAAPVNCGGPWTDALWDCGQIAGLGRAAGHREVICSQSRDTDQPDTQISISTGETTLDFQEQVTSLRLDEWKLSRSAMWSRCIRAKHQAPAATYLSGLGL